MACACVTPTLAFAVVVHILRRFPPASGAHSQPTIISTAAATAALYATAAAAAAKDGTASVPHRVTVA